MQDLVERIRTAYEQEQKNPYIPQTADQLPLRYEDITPEWLTLAICQSVPDAKVESLTLGPVDTGTSNRRKIAITYNAAGRAAGLPEKVFCKASQDLFNRLTLASLGAIDSEIAFYTRYQQHVPKLEAPTCRYAFYDRESFNSLVILDDLSDRVEAFPTHETYINLAKAKSQMAILAELHARFHEHNGDGMTLVQGQASWPEFFAKVQAGGLEQASNAGFLEAKEVVPAELYARYEEIWPATVASVEEHNALPKTLIHSDVHLKNWYVLPDDQMGLSDWQCCAVGHWGRDLAYTISTALTTADRRAWEQELVRYYVEQLQARGLTDVTFAEAWTHYRKQLMTALVWWTVTLHPCEGMPDMQPRDITLDFIGRISTAIDDLNSLDLF